MKLRVMVCSVFFVLVALVLSGCSFGFSKRDDNGLENGVNVGNGRLPDSWTSVLPNPPGEFVASASVRDLPVITTKNVTVEDIRGFVEEARSFGFVSQLDTNVGDNIAVSLRNEDKNLSLNIAGTTVGGSDDGGRAVFTVVRISSD